MPFGRISSGSELADEWQAMPLCYPCGMPWIKDTTQARDPVVQHGMDMLGAAVRRQRLRLHLSQTDLSYRTGIHQSTISRFERGRRCGLRWSRFAKLVAVLGGLDFGDREPIALPGYRHQVLTPNPWVARQAELAAAADEFGDDKVEDEDEATA